MILHISGAGPAGLAAAISAARAGASVVVHERRQDVGGRFHDDFQGLENWTTEGDVLEELASFGIEVNFECTPIRETIVFDPAACAHTYRSAEPLYYLVRRGPGPGTLDSGLREQAERAGVTIRFGEQYRDLPGDGIFAGGPRRPCAIAVGYVFDTTMSDGAYGAISDSLAAKGYSYLLVHAGRGTVASTIFEDFHQEKAYLARTVAFFERHAGLVMCNARRFGGTANFGAPHSARRGGILLAGEAAGFQDSLWGFGIRYAMVSGHLAARAHIEGRPEDYDRLWTARIGAHLRTGVVNRFVYRRLGDRGGVALTRQIDRAPDARVWLRQYYGSSLLKRALFPVASRALRTKRLISAH